jgi:hypothetical protein
MYGFLQVDRCKLNPGDRAAYAQMYCGQCAALHRLFGYSSRAMVSYDATFLGLLISAQQKEEVNHTKSWCGVFPKRMTIHDPAGLPQIFSAGMAAIICSMNLADSQEDETSFIKNIANRIFTPTFKKAEGTLRSLNFPADIVTKTLERQKKIESSDRLSIKEYAEPTALFLAEAFRFTATVTGNNSNEEPLYEIGYHVGQLIYLIDCCIDIIDDIEKDSFNGLMAAYRNDETFRSDFSRDEVTAVAINALTKIKELVKALELKKYQNIIANILLVGFPQTIHQRIEKSIKCLHNTNEMLLKYLPHASLASAICLLTSQNAEGAGFVIGKIDRGDSACGFSILPSSSGVMVLLEVLFNPFIYYWPNNEAHFCDKFCLWPLEIVCQAPKAICSYNAAAKIIELNRKKSAEKLKLNQQLEAKLESERKELQRKQEAEKQAAISRSKKETLINNHDFTERYVREIQKIKRYYINIGMSYSINDALENLIKSARSKDEEVLTDSHSLIKQIEAFMIGVREDKQLTESVYDKHKSRIAKYTGRKMAIFESVSVRKLTSLLSACASEPAVLIDLVVQDFRQTDAYSLLQQMDEYDFISGNAKRLQTNLKLATQKSLKEKSVADIFAIYNQLKELMLIIEKSSQALFSSQTAAIDLIHKDWNGYHNRLKNIKVN